MRTIAVIPSAALLAGSACGLLFAHLLSLTALTGDAALAASIAVAVLAYRLRRPALVAAAVAAGFFVGGVVWSAACWEQAWRPPLRAVFEQLARQQREEAAREGRRLPEDDSAFATVEGILRSDASPVESGASLSVLVDCVYRQNGPAVYRPCLSCPSCPSRPSIRSRPEAGGIVVTVVGSIAVERIDQWRAGRRLRFPVQLRRPSRYLDPGVPDFERALARRGTTLVGSVKSGALVEVVRSGSRPGEWLGAVRAFARRAIAAAVGRWSASSAAIVSAIVIGDRAGLNDDVVRRLQEAGTYHVIAISGGNIAILAGLLLGGFRFTGWLGRGAMAAAIALLIVYARLVGGGASVDRATLMAVVYLGARAFDHRTPPLNVLALVAGLLVAADPLAIADPAFLLTFGATLAIIVTAPAAARRRSPAVLRALTAMAAASGAAEVMLFPVGALLFSRVTFAGLGLNFLAIPLMAVAQIAGMAVVPLALVSTGAAALAGLVAHFGAAGLVWSSQLVRVMPVVAYRIRPPTAWMVAIYYLSLAAAWIAWRRGSGWIGDRDTRSGRRLSSAAVRRVVLRIAAPLAFASGAWILLDPMSFLLSRGDGRLHVTFIDVGQGDASLVRFPGGGTLLVDAGGIGFESSFDIGERIVAAVVRDAGFYRLDRLALTHGDPDHIGGAGSVIEEFRPREVWEGIPVPRFAPLTALRVQAQAGGAHWANVYAGDRTTIDGVEVSAWHPTAADWERQKVRNDDSIVLELRWRDVSILLTGDIGRSVEAELARSIPPAPLRVVKMAHHGSLTSSSEPFLAAVRPGVAVVSAGRANHFGHPAPEVLARYRAVGAEIFRTDRDGAVTVSTDGTDIDVRTFTGRTISLRAGDLETTERSSR